MSSAARERGDQNEYEALQREEVLTLGGRDVLIVLAYISFRRRRENWFGKFGGFD